MQHFLTTDGRERMESWQWNGKFPRILRKLKHPWSSCLKGVNVRVGAQHDNAHVRGRTGSVDPAVSVSTV